MKHKRGGRPRMCGFGCVFRSLDEVCVRYSVIVRKMVSCDWLVRRRADVGLMWIGKRSMRLWACLVLDCMVWEHGTWRFCVFYFNGGMERKGSMMGHWTIDNTCLVILLFDISMKDVSDGAAISAFIIICWSWKRMGDENEHNYRKFLI